MKIWRNDENLPYVVSSYYETFFGNLGYYNHIRELIENLRTKIDGQQERSVN